MRAYNAIAPITHMTSVRRAIATPFHCASWLEGVVDVVLVVAEVVVVEGDLVEVVHTIMFVVPS